jgi:hypothetical protein
MSHAQRADSRPAPANVEPSAMAEALVMRATRRLIHQI